MSSIRNLPKQVDVAIRRVATDAPYPRFVIDEVLDPREYKELLEDFPDQLMGEPDQDGYASYSINPERSIGDEFSPLWQQVISDLGSQDLKSQLVQACRASAFRRYPAWWRWLLWFRLANVNNYDLRLTFSANYAGRYLPPHNDNSYKVLALVLYFAPYSYTGIEEGTRFFRAKSNLALKTAIRRFNRLSDSRITRLAPLVLQPMTSARIHSGALATLEEHESEQWFRDHFVNDFNVEFHPNRIAGFIKTQDSFHAVDMRISTFAGPRRCLLINLNLKHSFVARAWQSFRARVLKLSS
jgi:hypothetical protein